MASKTKSISFKEKYEEQYKFLLKQENPSGFVCELIKKHMDGGDDFELRVRDVLVNYLSNLPQTIYQYPPVGQPSNQIQQEDNTQDKIDEIEDPW